MIENDFTPAQFSITAPSFRVFAFIYAVGMALGMLILFLSR